MQNEITVGFRSKSGLILAEVCDPRVLYRILFQTDLITPDENSVEAVIDEYRLIGPDYRTTVAPYGKGIIFFDFQDMIVYNGQGLSHFPSVTSDSINDAILYNPETFNRLIPHFCSVWTVNPLWYETQEGDSLIETTIERSQTAKSLWDAAGIMTKLEEIRKFNNGNPSVIFSGIVSSDDTFEAFSVDLPGWTVQKFDSDSATDVLRMKEIFARNRLITREDEADWQAFQTFHFSAPALATEVSS